MSKIIILEGPDGAGKSELALRLRDHYRAAGASARYLHHDQRTMTEEYVTGVCAGYLMRPYASNVLIMDRCWYSEPIYGAAFRGGADRVGEANCRTLERIYHSAETSVILCLPAWSTVRRNWANRGGKEEMLDNVAQLEQVYQLYGFAGRTSWRLPTTVYDYEVDELPKALLAPCTKPSQFSWKDFLV